MGAKDWGDQLALLSLCEVGGVADTQLEGHKVQMTQIEEYRVSN